MHIESKAYQMFKWFNHGFLLLLSILCILPLIHLLAISFSGAAAADANLIMLLPVDFTLEPWIKMINNPRFGYALYYGFERTVLGTVITMIVLAMAAYPLSKDAREFKGRTFYMYFFVGMMLLQAGLIPQYILISKLGLMNTVWALILTGIINVFHLILLINFFRTGIPKDLEEAAFIDGAGHFRAMWSIYLPISKPAIATIALFTMVSQWNSWFDGLIYITDMNKFPLSTYLQTMIVNPQLDMIQDVEALEELSDRTAKAAQIFISMLPIILVYPFLQKYFVKGIVLGSVKE
ncbi:polysaccharide ABC transporter permease [Paenibacillus algicola]|uniref:Polysaccharide ABC transporter permease n=1 Tax=Paenibacillus algicola TaxID=2565926 RepID=A0A4P8XGW4_9BACL|nr:polysaccharide ABC transporter permease [Paenibacillus algicola]